MKAMKPTKAMKAMKAMKTMKAMKAMKAMPVEKAAAIMTSLVTPEKKSSVDQRHLARDLKARLVTACTAAFIIKRKR